ncbi:MAG TPA: hypothetical protein VGG70_00270 [Candidatus Cybelea sp.]
MNARERIAELLEDETRSFRSIGRELGVSDWLVRKTARELNDDRRPMRQRRSRSQEPPSAEVSPLVSWLVFGGFLAVLALAIWAGARSKPPLDSTDFPYGFYPNPYTERTDDETQFTQ